jgi:hypothetical protein
LAVYLVGFTASALCAAVAAKRRFPQFLLFSAIAVLIPCLIAGLRSQFIGTDVLVYVKNLTRAAISAENIQQYFKSYWFLDWRNLYVADYEPGFSLLVYVVARLTGHLGPVLFAIQLFTVAPIYVALARNRKHFPVWLGLLVYYLLFFNITLNAMRQWMAMAFLLLSFQMLREKHIGLTALFCVAAFLFHFSAILIIPIYFVYWLIWLAGQSRLVHHNLQVRAATLIAVGIFCVALFAIMNLPLVLQALSALGFDRYNNYLEGNQFHITLQQFYWRVPLLMILLCNWKDFGLKEKCAPFYLAMFLLDAAASQLVSVDVNALRICHFFSVFCILWVPAVYGSCRQGWKRALIAAGFTAYALFYWYYNYVHAMRNATYPYQFFF